MDHLVQGIDNLKKKINPFVRYKVSEEVQPGPREGTGTKMCKGFLKVK